ncbi:zinc finger bed domain-containing protein ricesleeper 2-like [Gigaspora margarita]|uniref:Zinc finger bed domain-containing protein ricesleeper 2-like n=1 Tax=Gigaspora margarita TaxID=4874 RepID=A0A8H4EPY3_GIGMA|nr:zinc finger bed domain-containing protein ricesleeper 2-like [Gigaspora margarita]
METEDFFDNYSHFDPEHDDFEINDGSFDEYGLSDLTSQVSQETNITRRQAILNFSRTDPHNDDEQNKRDKILIMWIIADQQLFTVIENKQFTEFINFLDPRYITPIRQTAKKMILDEFDTFLGVTLHFIDADWKMRHFLLDIIPFNDRHTGINMADAINNLLNDFNLKDKTLALTTYNESAMIICGRLIAHELQRKLDNIGFLHYRCAAHVPNLAAKQGLEIVDPAVEKVRTLMLKIKVSTRLSDNLRGLCQLKGI